MSSRDHTELANPFDRSSVSRRWWLLGAIVTIGLLPLVFQELLLAYKSDRVRAQRHAGHWARFHSRLRRPTEPWPLRVLRHWCLCFDAGHYEARLAILGGVPLRDRTGGCSGNGFVDVCGPVARPLPCDRLPRLCRHRAPGAGELDQPDARAAWHLRHQAAAGDCAARPAGHLFRQFGEHVLSGRRFRTAFLRSARPARPLTDRRDTHRNPRGRGLSFFARH